MAFVQTAHILSPANAKNLMSIEPVDRHRYPLPITKAMITRPQDPPSTAGAPVLPTTTSIDPTSSPVRSADFVLTVYGTNFRPDSVILWNGSPESTDFIDDNELQTVVRASMATVPSTATVAVRTGAQTSTPNLTFTFT